MEKPEASHTVRRPQISKVVLALVWTLLGLQVAPILLGFGLAPVAIFNPQAFDNFEKQIYTNLVLEITVALISFALITVPLFYFFFEQKLKKGWQKILGVQRSINLEDVGKAVGAFVLYFGVTVAVISVITALVPGFNVEQEQQLGIEPSDALRDLIGVFLLLVVVPPIVEEFLFRGFLFSALRREISFWPATLLTSGAFALVHFQWNVGVDVFVLSIFLCWLRERTGAIWASISLHAIKNGMAFILLYILKAA